MTIKALFQALWAKYWSRYFIIHYDEQSLTITLALAKGPKLHCYATQSTPLPQGIIAHHRIYNPTYLNTIIKNFAHGHGVNKPHLIVCIPDHHTSRDPFTTLQTALCLSKNDMIIDYLISNALPILGPVHNHTATDSCPSWHSIKNAANALQMLAPASNRITTHTYALSLSLVISLGVASGFFYYQSRTTHIQYTQQHKHLVHNISNLQTKVKATRELEQKNSELTKQSQILTSLRASQQNPVDFLTTIASNMPEHSALTAVHLGKFAKQQEAQKKAPHKKPQRKETLAQLTIKGITYNPKEISSYAKKLADARPDAQFSTANIRKNKRTPKSTTPTTYTFSIHGELLEQHYKLN